jgi:predicted O-methyltransferase YrrM/protein-S-isoprenylcysteine O-methyltransferase Ste14
MLLDVVALAVDAGFAMFFLGMAVEVFAASGTTISVVPPFAFDAVAATLIGIYLWIEGRRQIQFQRPDGIVAGEFLVLAGAFELLAPPLYEAATGMGWTIGSKLFWSGWIVVGAALIGIIVPRFLRRREEHRIIERVSSQDEAIQAEYTPATAECPHPERWKMLDSMTAEVEVLDFLKSLVMTVKPELVVETGTFVGLSAIKMAEGMKANGFGRIITCEFDPVVFQKAKERIAASGLSEWIECLNESSLDMKIDGTIDIFFSDSDIPIREKEIRKFLPQINPNGIVLTHDASSHYKIVREAALRLEEEGLLSVVLVATPRGLVIAQKREGRK